MAPTPRPKAARARLVRKEIAGWLVPIVERERYVCVREKEREGLGVCREREREWSIDQDFWVSVKP